MKFGRSDCATGSEIGEFYQPNGIAVDSSGNIYVADTSNRRIQKAPATSSSYVIESGTNFGIGTESPTEALEVVGNIKVVDGNQGEGKVLVSDADGVASWQEISSDSITINEALKLTPISTAPTDPSAGLMYFDSNDNVLKVYDGTTWQSCW